MRLLMLRKSLWIFACIIIGVLFCNEAWSSNALDENLFFSRVMKEKTQYQTIYHIFVFGICLLICSIISTWAEEKERLLFDVKDTGESDNKATLIQPWETVNLDPDYAGLWVVAGDADGDGTVEIISAQNFNKNDVHYTTTAVAQNLDGSVLWQWGDAKVGRKEWHHDVACQIYDWDGDGRSEVILCTKGYLVELDGATGEEIRRLPLPDEEATDCLVFADFSGNSRATDVLVKDRYCNIWAFDRDWNLLWKVKEPGGYRTAHQPRPIDIDGDGKDEVIAGYAMLNPDGTTRWVFQSQKVEQRRGHLDCCRVVRRGETPEEFRLALTCCGANDIAMVDGTGKVLWEIPGCHFESVDVGQIFPNRSELQLLVDIDHQPRGKSPLWVIDENGQVLGQIITNYSRHHTLIDWTGDGYHEILNASNRALYNHQGQRIATFDMPEAARSVLVGDMTGDGVRDIALTTLSAVYVFKNEKGKKTEKDIPFGTEVNFTLY